MCSPFVSKSSQLLYEFLFTIRSLNQFPVQVTCLLLLSAPKQCVTKVRHRSITAPPAYWDKRSPLGWLTPRVDSQKSKLVRILRKCRGGINKGFWNGPFQNLPVHNAPSVPSPRKHSYYYATPVPVPILFILFWYSPDALLSFRISVPLVLKCLRKLIG